MGKIYITTEEPKFYIVDKYGNTEEFGKFKSVDTDLVKGGEGKSCLGEVETIRTIKNNTATFNCNLNNVDLGVILGDELGEYKKRVRNAELRHHLLMEAKNGNMLSNVVLEGLNRGMISVDEALYFVSNGWKRMHGFGVTRYRRLGKVKHRVDNGNKVSKVSKVSKKRSKGIKQEIICDIFNRNLRYLCWIMYDGKDLVGWS